MFENIVAEEQSRHCYILNYSSCKVTEEGQICKKKKRREFCSVASLYDLTIYRNIFLYVRI